MENKNPQYEQANFEERVEPGMVMMSPGCLKVDFLSGGATLSTSSVRWLRQNDRCFQTLFFFEDWDDAPH